MVANTNVLITGASRGIGKGLVAEYSLRPNYTVVAAVRDPAHTASKSLHDLPLGLNSTLIVVPLDSSSEVSINNSIAALKTQYSINSLSVVIANAGMAEFYGSLLETPTKSVRDHFNTNTVGTLVLFQTVYPLLTALSSGEPPKFVTISSTVGSVTEMEPWKANSAAYGMSKAALNWLTRNIHFEHPDVIAFPIHPGWVKTDMGNASARANGLVEAPTAIETSVHGIVSIIDTASREATSGNFIRFDGNICAW